MRARLAACELCIGLVATTSLRSQPPLDPDTKAEVLRAEIKQVQTAIAALTDRLNDLQRQLAEVRAPRPGRDKLPDIPPGLRFPVDIERAMLDGAAPKLENRITGPSSGGATTGGPSPRNPIPRK